MPSAAIGLFVHLLDAAFARPHSPDGDTHSFLGNLTTLPPEALDWLPEGGGRSARDIALHVGWGKFMYDDYAFRSGSLRGDAAPAIPTNAADMTVDELVAWLREGHARLMESASSLDDSGLTTQRPTNWGGRATTRWILQAMIEHDLYHAGEVNHLRALYTKSDNWAYEP